MAEYRTVKMSFWTDPYIESLPADGKLLYIYLFTCPLVNNLGIMETTVKRIAYETDIDAKRVAVLLAEMEKNGKLMHDGNFFWLTNFIKNQCTTSPKLLQSMKTMLETVESKRIRRALCLRYPHIFECAEEQETDDEIVMRAYDTDTIPYEYPIDTVSIPSWELGNRNRELRINTPPSPSQGALCVSEDAPQEKYPADFEEFWKLYPKKADKLNASKAWKKQKAKIPKLDVLKAAIETQQSTDQWQRGIIPNASTWLNGHRWEDNPDQQTNFIDTDLLHKWNQEYA